MHYKTQIRLSLQNFANRSAPAAGRFSAPLQAIKKNQLHEKYIHDKRYTR